MRASRRPPLHSVAALALGAWLLAACGMTPYRDTPPRAPVTLGPTEASELVYSQRTRFEWLAVEDADVYEFHVFDRQTGDISRYYQRELRPRDVCESHDDRTERVCSVTLGMTLPYMKGHAWRVRAGNFAGWSPWTRLTFGMVSSAQPPGVSRSRLSQ